MNTIWLVMSPCFNPTMHFVSTNKLTIPLIVCACCGYAYYGKAISPGGRKHHLRSYASYQCIGSDAYRFSGVRLCWNKQLRTDLVDEAVWKEVCRLLEHPERLEQENRRCLVHEEKLPEES